MPAPNRDDQIRNYQIAQVAVGFHHVIQKEPQSDFS